MADAIATFDQPSFAEELATADKPILVDFWAEWCGPCRALEPILKEVASENGDKITVAKVNVDENPDIAMRFNVMSIPTLLVFDKGEVQKRLVGAKNPVEAMQLIALMINPQNSAKYAEGIVDTGGLMGQCAIHNTPAYAELEAARLRIMKAKRGKVRHE